MPRLYAALVLLAALGCLLACPAQATRYGGQPLRGAPPTKPTKQRAPATRPALLAASPISQPRAAEAPATDSPALVYLTGVVQYPDGRPCPGVCVFPSNAPLQIVATNAKGEFQLSVPAHKAITLQAELLGKGSGRVAIAGESAQPVRIVLER